MEQNFCYGVIEDAIAIADFFFLQLKSKPIVPKSVFVLQNQVATLLQVKSCHADASQIQRLTQALVQKEGEVKMLNTKISTLEKQKVTFIKRLNLVGASQCDWPYTFPRSKFDTK